MIQSARMFNILAPTVPKTRETSKQPQTCTFIGRLTGLWTIVDEDISPITTDIFIGPR